jgi:hypothetical protein
MGAQALCDDSAEAWAVVFLLERTWRRASEETSFRLFHACTLSA